MTHHDRKLTVPHPEFGRKSADGDDHGLTRLAEGVKSMKGEIERFAGDASKALAEHGARLDEVDQKLARRGGLGGTPAPATKTWGRALVESADFKALAGSASQRGMARVELRNAAALDPTGGKKSITSVAGSGASLIVQDPPHEPVTMPRRPLTIRQLLAPGEVGGNTVFYPVQTIRNLNAAPVAEGALKPESNIQFDQKQVPVQTIAHFLIASRQIMDDAPALMSLVDTELRFGVDLAEETEMLAGDGTGVHLLGIIPQATPFTAPFSKAGDTAIDILLQAVAQSEAALLPCTGIVLHPIDWRKIQGIKDAGGNYLLPQGPFGNGQARSLWDVPIAASFGLQQGKFLTGAFADGAQIFDRMETEVLISSEDSDNFRRNLITVRAEKRMAMAVKRPQAFIYGSLPA